MMSSMYAQYDFLISLCRGCLISLYLSKTFGHCVFFNFVVKSPFRAHELANVESHPG